MRKIVTILLALLFVAGPAMAQRANMPTINSTVEDGFSSRVPSGTPGAVRYGDVIDCRGAEMISLMYTTSCTAVNAMAAAIEWLPEDVGNSNRSFPLCLPIAGDNYPLSSGFAWIDAATTNTRTSNADWLVSSYIKAPFCRVAVAGRKATANGPSQITVRYYLRYRKQD